VLPKENQAWTSRLPNQNYTATYNPISAPIETSLPENTAGRQPRFPIKTCSEKFGKKLYVMENVVTQRG
jgi:hypothetical protein